MKNETVANPLIQGSIELKFQKNTHDIRLNTNDFIHDFLILSEEYKINKQYFLIEMVSRNGKTTTWQIQGKASGASQKKIVANIISIIFYYYQTLKFGQKIRVSLMNYDS